MVSLKTVWQYNDTVIISESNTIYGNEIHKNNNSTMVLFAISFDTRCTMV